jgi:hypothetical protein
MDARHFLTLGPLGPAGLRALLDLAHRAKGDPARSPVRSPAARSG